MPTYQKIPPHIRKQGCVAINGYAIFCKGLLKAAAISQALLKADKKTGIPAVGTITHHKIKYYYCRYGFLKDPDIYTDGKSE